LTFALVPLLALAALGQSAQAAEQPDHHPSRLAHLADAGQVIVVTAPTWGADHGTLRAYERVGVGGWREVVGATPAWLGSNGLVAADRRRQGTNTTPAGTFAIPSAFGRSADPGTALPYLRVDHDDAWTYNPRSPSTYNVLQTANLPWRTFGSYVEHLWDKGRQYDYVAVLDYNLPTGPITTGAHGVRRSATPPDTRAGGGIFLHVSKGIATAGCVSIAKPVMRRLLRWLDPARHPVIVIGPEAEITTM